MTKQIEPFSGRYWIEREPSDMTVELAAALGHFGYRVESQSADAAYFIAKGGLSGWNLILLFIPVLGWIILVFLIATAPPSRQLVVNYGIVEGRKWMSVRADDERVGEMFAKLPPA